MRHISDADRRARLATRHFLAPSARGRTVPEVAESVVALHSSDPVTVYLSASLRTVEPSLENVERSLYEDRDLIRHHAMRRTLWVMTRPVAQAANAAFSRGVAAAERSRTAKFFGHDESWVDASIDRLVEIVAAAAGPISTREVGEFAPDLSQAVPVNQGRNYEGRIAPHTRLLLVAAMEGRISRNRPAGSWIGSQYAWTVNEEWMAMDWSVPDEATGLVEIVGRWLHRFGPGTLEDVVWWTGAGKRVVRQAILDLEAEAVALSTGEGFVARGDDAGIEDPGPWVAMLPGLDPTPMGWKQRHWYLSPEMGRSVTDRNGNIGPTVWVDGRVVGSWVQRGDGTIAHDVDPDGLSSLHRRQLDEETERIRAVVGERRFTVRFPTPSQKQLLAE